MGPLQGKVAVVTGASRGLGKGVALVLAEQGADVVVNYRSQAEEAEEVCRDVRAMGVRALALQADVGTGAAVDAMFAKIDEFSAVITDKGIPDEYVTDIHQHGVDLIIV